MHIRSKDTVVVITGKDKGKEGKVLVASPKTGKVVVEGVAIATKHQKPRQQGVPGGIVKKEAAIDASNVMLVCPDVYKRQVCESIFQTGKETRGRVDIEDEKETPG